jgi:phosphatidylserine/phosphatidylglycerophosphate/cardiolipin synthase-like enzyme
MGARHAHSSNDLFEAKAAEMSGTRFALGTRTGPRKKMEIGLATCAFQNGICVEVGHTVAYAIPAAVSRAWMGSGAQAGPFGLPTNDPMDIDGARAAQEFEFVTYLFGGATSYGLSRPVWEASVAGRGMIGAPIGPPESLGTGIGKFTPHDRGVVLEAEGTLPQPLTQDVFDLWTAQANRGAALGPPTAFAFPSSTKMNTTVYPFAAGTILLDSGGAVSLGPAISADPQRFFLPRDQTQHLLSYQSGAGATALIGGEVALAAMQADIARARGGNDFIYICNWHCDVDLPLVPGKDSTTLRRMLRAAAAAKVQIRAMFWAGSDPASSPMITLWPVARILAGVAIRGYYEAHKPNFRTNAAAAQCINGFKGDVAAILDNQHRSFGMHHQKILVLGIDGNLIAYVGGVDFNPDRLFSIPSSPGTPLFDISVRLEGAAAHLALDTFVRRWQAHPARSGAPLRGSSSPMPLTTDGSLAVQLTHTYAKGYPFPVPVQTARTALANAIGNARRYFYLEDQYFTGFSQMSAVIRVVLSGHPNLVGILVTGPDEVCHVPDLPSHRRSFFAPIARAFPGRFLVFERLGAGATTGPTAFVHSKVLIVDDEAAFIGSVNSNRRSWYHDSEVDATIVDRNGPGASAFGSRGWVREFRCSVWASHLNQPASSLGDVAADLAIWQGISRGTISGSSVRPYGVHTRLRRYTYHGIPIPVTLLQTLWNELIDPV